MVDAVAMLPLAVSAAATSGPVLRAPLIVVVLFCSGCVAILLLGQRVARLPLVGRWDRLDSLSRRVADSTRLTRATLTAGLLLLGCWTSRALGSALLLSALGVRFSPTLALVVLCMSAATAILPITAGGAVAGMGTTAGVLFALGVSKGVALNYALASGLLLTSAALAAAAFGLTGSVLLTLRARRSLVPAIAASALSRLLHTWDRSIATASSVRRSSRASPGQGLTQVPRIRTRSHEAQAGMTAHQTRRSSTRSQRTRFYVVEPPHSALLRLIAATTSRLSAHSSPKRSPSRGRAFRVSVRPR